MGIPSNPYLVPVNVINRKQRHLNIFTGTRYMPYFVGFNDNEGTGFRFHLRRLEAWAISFTPLCLCLSEETVNSRWSLLSGVCARGSKRSHAGKWKTPVIYSLTLWKDTLKKTHVMDSLTLEKDTLKKTLVIDSLTLEKDTLKKQLSIISKQILLNGWWLPNIKKNVFAPNWACWSKRT